MLIARDGLSGAAAAVGVGWVELGEAQRSSCGLRFALSGCGGLPVQAGSRPGGRGTFFVRTKKVPKESRPASTPRLCRGALRCSRRRGPAELALAALGAQTVLGPAVLRTSEPGNAALLGVSEGEGKASTFPRCPILVAWVQAKGRNPGCTFEDLDAPAPDFAALHPGYETHAIVAQPMVLIFGSRRERRVAERDREEGRGLSEHRAQRGRVPQAPGRASNAGKSGAQHLTANAGSPFLGYFFWRSKGSNTPAGGGTPAEARLLGVIRRSARWASMPSAQARPTPTHDHDRQCQNMRRRP